MVARPGDRDALDVDDEQRRLRAALAGLERDGLVELAWVNGQTYRALEDALEAVPGTSSTSSATAAMTPAATKAP